MSHPGGTDPDDPPSRPGKPDDAPGHPGEPGESDDATGDPGEPDNPASRPDEPDVPLSRPGEPDDPSSQPAGPDDPASHPGEPDGGVFDDVLSRPGSPVPEGTLLGGRRPPRIRRAMSRRVRSVLSWAWVLLAAVTLALLMRTFLVAAFYIPSESMEPVLEIGDRLLVSKLSYRIGDPEPGDVVVFRTPPSMQAAQTSELIKRVVAVGGQTVAAVGGQLIIDGTPVREEYLPAGVHTRDFGTVLVPAGYVFVMGDNRSSSQDSRYFGAIPEGEIVGRAFARFWPPTRLGGL